MVAPARRPFLSIVVPVRNEAGFIGPCLESILATTYPRDRMEVLVVDGMSEDHTRAIVAHYAARHAEIRVLDNPQRIVPTGLNAAIRAAAGDVIVRVDAHATYPPTYISSLVTALEESGADNVGGVVITLPVRDAPIARAIACGLAHPLGVGNAHFRIGTARPRWVDTVPFGCYRRGVFERVGLFDEAMVRNEDDEFNFRLRRRGGRILLVPSVTCSYYARATLGKVARMFYQYGYWKPLVAKKVGGVMTGRQLAPPLALLGVTGVGLASIWWPAGRIALGTILAGYAALVLGVAAQIARREGFRCGLAFGAVPPVLHLSYGVGYLRGIVDHWLSRGRNRVPATVPLTR